MNSPTFANEGTKLTQNLKLYIVINDRENNDIKGFGD
jgi:hypothetical protein